MTNRMIKTRMQVIHGLIMSSTNKYDVATAIKDEAYVILKGTQFCSCNCFKDSKCRSNGKVVSWFSVFLFFVSFGEVSRMQDYFKSILVVKWPHFRK